MPAQVPLWEAMRPTDRNADFGAGSAEEMKVSLWLERHHPNLMVKYSAPVNWADVYAILVQIQDDVPCYIPLRQVLNRLAEYLGFRQTA